MRTEKRAAPRGGAFEAEQRFDLKRDLIRSVA
jgi:hypothetical protein